ncbi:MAG: hypothetical protein MUF01_10120 [Bryobacterales bacterium]|nr:hypothetical protein [Bryobacterales bacterium]
MKHTGISIHAPALVVVWMLGMLLTGCGGGGSTAETAPPRPQAAQPAKILFFYPGQESVSPGDQAQVCYGVENATSVRLDPPLADIRPLSNKCLWVTVKSTTPLRLIAQGEDGAEVEATMTVAVKAGSPSSTRTAPEAPASTLIETFTASTTTVSPGGGATICYVLSEPATLQMSPSQGNLGSDLKKCVLVKPQQTTTYTLTANGGGKTDSVSITIRVQ